jgi:hypothetical protein
MAIQIVDQSPNGQVIQKITKPNGEFLRYQAGAPGQNMQEFPSLRAARLAIGLFTIKVVDKSEDGQVVEKVTIDGQLIRYQAGIPGQDMSPFSTLQAARTFIGKGGKCSKR